MDWAAVILAAIGGGIGGGLGALAARFLPFGEDQSHWKIAVAVGFVFVGFRLGPILIEPALGPMARSIAPAPDHYAALQTQPLIRRILQDHPELESQVRARLDLPSHHTVEALQRKGGSHLRKMPCAFHTLRNPPISTHTFAPTWPNAIKGRR